MEDQDVTHSAEDESIMRDDGELRPLRSATVAGGSAPSRILLAPWGHVESTNGSFVIDEESSACALAAFESHGTDLPIDYEHQTLGGDYASPSGQAPAAGWIKRIAGEPGIGLMADITWTDRAKDMVAAREYRYLSPVAVIRKGDRKLIAIHSAALTNKPAIVGMEPIVNRATPAIEDAAPLAVLRDELELPAEANAEEVLVAASERLRSMQHAARQRHVEERIRDAMRAGKLVEAQRAWAEALVAKEEGLFDAWLETAPVVISRGATKPPEDDATHESGQRALVAKARAEFRSQPLLGRLTTEEAYVADAVRQHERRCA